MNPIGQLIANLDYGVIALKTRIGMVLADADADTITDFLTKGSNEATDDKGALADLKTKVEGYGNGAISVATSIGIIIAVIGVIIFGWRVLISASSPQERAENKKAAMPVLAGCCILGAAIPVVTFIVQVGQGLFK